jgi:hypothetical protein
MSHIVCLGCGDDRQRDPQTSKPGENHYKPCKRCGPGVGITDANDKYEQRFAKKANRTPYESSPYRGGKLTPPAKEKP